MRKNGSFKGIFLLLIALCLIIFSFKGLVYSRNTSNVSFALVPHEGYTAVAIDTSTDRVFGAKEDEGIDIIDINTGIVVNSILPGKEIKAIAVDEGRRILAAIGGKKTLHILSADTYSILTSITFKEETTTIAADSEKGLLLIADEKDNVSIIDLNTSQTLKEIKVSEKPVAIAIDPQLHIAVVIHNTWGKGDDEDEKDKDKKNRDNITIIDLNTLSITKTLQAGKNPINVAINPLTHEAAVANEKSDDITVIDLNVLTVKGTIPIGKHPKALSYNECLNTLSVVGGEDKAWMKLIEETGTLKASYTFNDELNDIKIHSYLNRTVLAGEEGLRIVNLPNPPPQLLSITPESALRGGKSATFTLTGKGLLEPTETYLNGNRVNSTFLTCGSIRAEIPDSYLNRAGYIEIRTVNPAPEGGASNTITLTVNNPMPSITALEPAEVFAGTQSLVLNISGTGFFDDTEVYFGGLKKQETFINTTKLQVELTAQELNTPGKYEIMTYNSPPGGGNSNSAVFTIKSPLEVRITGPTDGEGINKARIMVKGTFKSGSQDVGITVNGVVADIIGREWIANNVPLTPGINTITATLKDAAGNKAETSITVHVNDTTQQVRLSANITSGVPPLTTYFSVSTETPNPVITYQIDFEGDGIIDYSGETFEDISYTYISEGVFYPTVTVTDTQGNSYSDTIAITVLNKAEIDTLLKAKWEGMKGALANKDVEKAASYFLSKSRDRYRYLFTSLLTSLPDIGANMAGIEMISLEGGVSEYRLKREEDGGEVTYYIYFVLDGDGLWKIQQF